MLESKRSAEKTPAYDRLRQFHNHISIWVVNQILVRDDVEQRVQVLSHFIKVCILLRDLFTRSAVHMSYMSGVCAWARLPACACIRCRILMDSWRS
jgi:hypothetical protein